MQQRAGGGDPRSWNPGPVLYRLAKESVLNAERYASERASTSDAERRNREVDSCIATLVLVQAALEAWIKWTAHQEGVPLSGGLIDRWEQCAQIAEKAGRPAPPELPRADRRFLERLSAWRNYLLHGDDRASARLAELGLDREDLGASLARETLRGADVVLEYGSSATGGQLLQSEHLWPGGGSGAYPAGGDQEGRR